MRGSVEEVEGPFHGGGRAPNHQPTQAGTTTGERKLIMEKLLLKVPEVAARLSMSRGKVYELIRSGALPSVRIDPVAPDQGSRP